MENPVNVNLNLQKSNNYMVIVKSDKQLKAPDLTFYIKNFKIPDLSINSADVDVNQNIIKYPSQGRMEYEPLNLDILVDDNLNSYLQLVRWLHRIKNPEKLLRSHLSGYEAGVSSNRNIKQIVEMSNQFPIDYRDIDVIVTDRNHKQILKFNFVESWVSSVGGLTLDAQNSDYLTANTSFNYLYMRVFDMNNLQIVPPLDDNHWEF